MQKSIRVGTVLVVTGLAFGMISGCGAKPSGAGGKDPFYSVTLTNNSLFFARMKGQDDRYLYLHDIYYLQRTPPQPAAGKKGQPDQPGIQLVRQMNDLQGPKDEMVLNREHLLYYQELREDSTIVQGIHKQVEQAAKPAAGP